MYPKVSVIVPCYGVEKYLNRCMESLVNQTIRDIEIILIDDVSPDSVPEMCDEWAKKDPRIKVIHKEKNGGLGLARNTGLEVASGEYVAFVDSDDFVDNSMYECLYSFASSNDLDIAFCGFAHFDDNRIVDERIETTTPKVYEGSEVNSIVLKGMLTSSDSYRITDYEMSVWHGIYKRKVLSGNNLWFVSEREFISEDIIFHIDILPHCKKVGFIPEALYRYCLNPVSLTKVYKEDRYEKEVVLFKEILNRVKKNGIDWSVEDINKYFALKTRYVITQCISFIPQVGKRKIKEELRRFAASDELKEWIFPFYTKYPKRYMIFYLLIKFHLFEALIFLSNRK